MNSENGNNYEMLKCIWMASQVIGYKLCDNQFDCEKCMFDKVMRNYLNEKETQSSGKTNVLSTIEERLRDIKYDNNIVYLKNNLIAKEICQNTYYLGINPVLTSFLNADSSVTVYECGKDITAGQKIIRIAGEWGGVNITSPGNFMIYDRVGDPADSTLRSRWLAIIGAQQDLSAASITRQEWDSAHEKAAGIIEEIKSFTPAVGATMMDGGTRISHLHQLVGNRKYISILNSLIV